MCIRKRFECESKHWAGFKILLKLAASLRNIVILKPATDKFFFQENI